MHVILLKTIYQISSHQNLSIGLISILLYSKLPSLMYHFCQYLHRETKICFIVSARCTNTVTMDRFPKLSKSPVLQTREQEHKQDSKIEKWMDRHILILTSYFEKESGGSIQLKKLYGPFLQMEFNCLKARVTSRRHFAFYH